MVVEERRVKGEKGGRPCCKLLGRVIPRNLTYIYGRSEATFQNTLG